MLEIDVIKRVQFQSQKHIATKDLTSVFCAILLCTSFARIGEVKQKAKIPIPMRGSMLNLHVIP